MLTSTRTWKTTVALLEEARAERDWWPDSTYFEDDDE